MRWPKRRRGKNGLVQMRPSASTLRPTAARLKVLTLQRCASRTASGDRFTELAGRRPSVEKRSPDVRIEAYFTFDHVSFYIDLAGESLFKRGWRLEHGEAR